MGDSVVASPALVAHLERRLGKLVYGWSSGPDGEPLPFQVARFEGGRSGEVLSFATIGLSQSPATSPVSGRPLRLELVLSVHEWIGERNLPAVLQQVGRTMLATGDAIVRGEVIEMEGNVVSGAGPSALYATLPVYFDDAFATCRCEDGSDVAIVWLVPVYPSEVALIRAEGWDAFEDLVERRDPDLWDPTRDPVGAGSN